MFLATDVSLDSFLNSSDANSHEIYQCHVSSEFQLVYKHQYTLNVNMN